jgi:hypothetical protein
LKGTAAKYGLHFAAARLRQVEVFERVRWPDDQPGAWHLPHDVDEDYCPRSFPRPMSGSHPVVSVGCGA